MFEHAKASPAMTPLVTRARVLAFNIAGAGVSRLMVPNWGCWRHPAYW
jgi:hypothetical protein